MKLYVLITEEKRGLLLFFLGQQASLISSYSKQAIQLRRQEMER